MLRCGQCCPQRALNLTQHNITYKVEPAYRKNTKTICVLCPLVFFTLISGSSLLAIHYQIYSSDTDVDDKPLFILGILLLGSGILTGLALIAAVCHLKNAQFERSSKPRLIRSMSSFSVNEDHSFATSHSTLFTISGESVQEPSPSYKSKNKTRLKMKPSRVRAASTSALGSIQEQGTPNSIRRANCNVNEGYDQMEDNV